MKKYKPTTPGQRQKTSINYRELLTKGAKPKKALLKTIVAKAGRNKRGVITVRHQGGGHKRRYRMVDLMQQKIDIKGKIKSIEYDPYRTAFIALVVYTDGEQRYVLAPVDSKVGDVILTAEITPLKPGNRMKLENIPIGYFVHNVELRPGGGGKLARSAGSSLEVLGSDGGWSDLKMPSKELRKVSSACYASLGKLSNPENNQVSIGKAGRKRWMGIRPTVRGKAMNPVDHPYGGGEGQQPRGTKRPKTKWGKVTGGHKTRNKKKYSKKMIIKRRVKRKK